MPRERLLYEMSVEIRVPKQTESDLQAEIVQLKQTLSRLKQESDREIQELTSQLNTVNQIQSPSKGSPTKCSNISDQMYAIKKAHAEELALLNDQHSKQISALRIEIAQLKNQLAIQDSANAQLTVENIELQSKIQRLNSQLDEKNDEIASGKEKLHEYLKSFECSSIEIQRKLNQQVSQISDKFEQTSKNIQVLENRYNIEHKQNMDFSNTLHFLIKTMFLMADLSVPEDVSIGDLTSNPEILISMAKTVEDASEKRISNLETELEETKRKLSESLERLSKHGVSESVAKMLTSLGSLVMEVADQLDCDAESLGE